MKLVLLWNSPQMYSNFNKKCIESTKLSTYTIFHLQGRLYTISRRINIIDPKTCLHQIYT